LTADSINHEDVTVAAASQGRPADLLGKFFSRIFQSTNPSGELLAPCVSFFSASDALAPFACFFCYRKEACPDLMAKVHSVYRAQKHIDYNPKVHGILASCMAEVNVKKDKGLEIPSYGLCCQSVSAIVKKENVK
jgi:hypothetical protein